MSYYTEAVTDGYDKQIGQLLSVLVEVVEKKWTTDQLENWLKRDYDDWPQVKNLKRRQKRKENKK